MFGITNLGKSYKQKTICYIYRYKGNKINKVEGLPNHFLRSNPSHLSKIKK